MSVAERTAGSVSVKRRHIPGEPGLWLLLLGDMSAFGAYFMAFLHYRAQDVAGFTEAQTLLSQNFGAINTLLLLASSWFVIMALTAIRSGFAQPAQRLLSAAWVCGFAFVVVKYFEWGEKFRAGVTPLTNEFFGFYFILTGIHLVHLLTGLVVLACMIRMVRRGRTGDNDMMTLEGGGCFWHMVDLLWIVLFPLLYLVQ